MTFRERVAEPTGDLVHAVADHVASSDKRHAAREIAQQIGSMLAVASGAEFDGVRQRLLSALAEAQGTAA